MSGRNRSDIKAGTLVQVGPAHRETDGRDRLTKSSTHPHGIKVRLTNGVVGRVKKLLLEG